MTNVDYGKWQAGEDRLAERLEELGLGHYITHWSKINQFSDSDLILRAPSALVCFDTKTPLDGRKSVTVNLPTYVRALVGQRMGSEVWIYNPSTDMICAMVPAVLDWIRRRDRPLQSKTLGGEPYYIVGTPDGSDGNPAYDGWIPLETFLEPVLEIYGLK